MGMKFTKMHGLGNDFVIVESIRQKVDHNSAWAQSIARRRWGVGCDQILVADHSQSPQADFFIHIYNANGSMAGSCGNGIRCMTRFILDQGLSRNEHLKLETSHRIITAETSSEGYIRVDMGEPVFAPAKIPFIADHEAITYEIMADGEPCSIAVLSMGNPHAVLLVPSVTAAPVERLGALLARHPDFPESANVEFLEICDPHNARLRIYERGVGETPACGSGACAAVVAARRLGKLAPDVHVHLPGGTLDIHWNGQGETVWMSGATEYVYEGSLSS